MQTITRKGRNLVLASLFFAVLFCGMLYWYIKDMKEEDLGDVAVLRQPVPAFSEITENHVEIAKMPTEYIPSSAIRSLSQVEGKVARVSLMQGDILSKNQIAKSRAEGGLTYLIPEGHRAMTVSVNEVAGVAYLLEPGDFVDVLAYIGDEYLEGHTSTTLLQKRLILSVGQKYQDEYGLDNRKKEDGGTSFNTVTLAVTPAEAQQLALADEIGNIRLILRPVDDISTFQGKNTNPGGLLKE